MRCPDPDCGRPLPDEVWDVQEIARSRTPWEPDETPEVFVWHANCVRCLRAISAVHAAPYARDVTPIDPAPDEWCCPLCGYPVTVRRRPFGPVKVSARCKDGCGAVFSMHRQVVDFWDKQAAPDKDERFMKGWPNA